MVRSSSLPVYLAAALVCLAPSLTVARHLSMQDLQEFVDQLGDEILSHEGLRAPVGNSLAAGIHDLTSSGETPTVEDDDVPHPVSVNNWGAHTKLGQISGVAINPEDEPVVFHRGDKVWGQGTFDANNRLVDQSAISADALVTLDPDSGEVKSAWGAGLFHMPHGLTIDAKGNVYVTDAGTHQVLRFPNGSSTPDLVLGEKFVPGSDSKHFCKPTDVAVTETSGIFFVADGYCNSRIMKYNAKGELLKVIHGQWQVPHSLALFEDEDVLCVADREGRRLDCLHAGLGQPMRADQDETGQAVISYSGVGRPFAIAAKGTAVLSVSGGPDVMGITIDTAADTPKILDRWGMDAGLTEPHAIAISQNGDSVYVVETDATKRNNLHKFEVVRSPTFF